MHTLVATSDNKMMSFGHGKYGKLGTGNEDDSSFPSKIMFPNKSIKISQCISGYHISIGIDYDEQRVYTWGYSGRGILGRAIEGTNYIPKKIELKVKKIDHKKILKDGESKTFNRFPEEIQKVVIGAMNTLILTNTGTLFLYGTDEYSQSGLSNEKKIEREKMLMSSRNNQKALRSLLLIPIQIKMPVDKRIEIIDVAIGSHHIIALTKFSEIYSWGRNDEGQLGHGYMVKSIETPKIVESLLHERIKSVYA
jgi:alpha-tubulin suppressor-like RCC1 family protein